jgi:hypothetical protein
MAVIWRVLLLLVVAALLLAAMVAGGGVGTAELAVWLAVVVAGLAVVAWGEVRRGRRQPSP